MKTIWKAPFDLQDVIVVQAKADASIVSIQKQNGVWCVWFEVDQNKPNKALLFYCVGTGHQVIRDNWLHITTVQDGPMVWHFYQETSYHAIGS